MDNAWESFTKKQALNGNSKCSGFWQGNLHIGLFCLSDWNKVFVCVFFYKNKANESEFDEQDVITVWHDKAGIFGLDEK